MKENLITAGIMAVRNIAERTEKKILRIKEKAREKKIKS